MFIFITALIFSFNVSAVDEFNFRATGEKLPKKSFEKVVALLEKEFQFLAMNNGRVLEIFTDYDAEWAQAFARRWETDQVIVYGGIAALNGGSEDSFALALCHELGHLYGDIPYTEPHNQLSAEGQADYWATSFCFKRVVSKLAPKVPSREADAFCSQDQWCARGVDAALVLTAFFADNRNISHPKINTPDESRVSVTNLNHPEPQCRLDTYLSGLKGNLRPTCWFAE